MFSGEVRDAGGQVRYIVDGSWDRGLECYSTDRGITLCQSYYGNPGFPISTKLALMSILR